MPASSAAAAAAASLLQPMLSVFPLGFSEYGGIPSLDGASSCFSVVCYKRGNIAYIKHMYHPIDALCLGNRSSQPVSSISFSPLTS